MSEKLARVSAHLPAGTQVTNDVRVLEVRRIGDEAVVIVQRAQTPWRYGLPVDLVDTSHEYYEDAPVDSFEEWLEYLDIYLGVAFDTGLAFWGARAECADYVELRLEPAWPQDARLDDCSLPDSWAIESAAGKPLGALRRSAVDHIAAEDLRVEKGAPRGVVVELVRLALVSASGRGVDRMTTDVRDPELDVLGFRDVDGVRTARTNLLDADPAAAAEIVRRDKETRVLPPRGWLGWRGSFAR